MAVPGTLPDRVAAGDDVEEPDRVVGLPYHSAPPLPDLVAHQPTHAVRGVFLRRGDSNSRGEGRSAPAQGRFGLPLEEIVGVLPLVVPVLFVHADSRQVPGNRSEGGREGGEDDPRIEDELAAAADPRAQAAGVLQVVAETDRERLPGRQRFFGGEDEETRAVLRFVGLPVGGSTRSGPRGRR